MTGRMHDLEAAFRFALDNPREEIRGVTWDLWGFELSHKQAIQRIVVAGFPIYKAEPKPHSPALEMFAIVEGESGEYQRAWHINVDRNSDNTITRDDQGRMRVTSVDLGFMQFSVTVTPFWLEMTKEAASAWVEMMFSLNPDLADPWASARKAYDFWTRRGFQPWYAYKPGTEAFMLKKRYGALAFSNWLVSSFVDPKARVVYK